MSDNPQTDTFWKRVGELASYYIDQFEKLPTRLQAAILCPLVWIIVPIVMLIESMLGYDLTKDHQRGLPTTLGDWAYPMIMLPLTVVFGGDRTGFNKDGKKNDASG